MSSRERRHRRGGIMAGQRARSTSEKRKPSGSPTGSQAPKTQKQLVQSTLDGPTVFTFGSTSSPLTQENRQETTHSPGSESGDRSFPSSVFNFINEASMDVMTTKLANVMMMPQLQDKFRQSFASIAKDVIQGLVQDIVTPLRREIQDLRHELEMRTDELEQYSRRNSIRIAGVPEQTQDNTETVTMDILKEVHPDITFADIDRCHRVGRKVQGKKRNIVVKFVSYWDKNRVMKNKGTLRHKATRESIYINEDLTQTRSKLFKFTRDLKRQGKIEATWTFDGRVYICEQKEGLIKVVNCEKDLEKYL